MLADGPDSNLWTSMIPLIVGSILLPLLTWFARGAYDKWRFYGIYLAKIGGTEQCAGLAFRPDGLCDAVTFGLQVKVVNATNKLLVVEAASIYWDNVRSPHIPSLKGLRDSNAEVIEQGENLEDKDLPRPCIPLAVAANGGIAYLRIQGRLSFYRPKRLVLTEQFWPTIDKKEESEFITRLHVGTGTVALRINGKIRLLHGQFWRRDLDSVENRSPKAQR